MAVRLLICVHTHTRVQVVVQGPVPLKVSATGAQPPLAYVSDDGRQYGVAAELGADPVRVCV